MSRVETTVEALKQQFAERRDALLDAARAAGGVVDPQQWEELERLRRLIDLGSATDVATTRRERTRTFQIGVAGVIALLVLTLLLIRFPSTRIGLQAQATHAVMTLQQRAALTPPITVRWLVAEGHSAANVVLSDGRNRPLDASVVRVELVEDEPAAGGGATQPVSRGPRADDSGARIVMRLPPAPAGVRVGLDAGFGDGSLAISMCGLEEPLAVNVVGAARVLSGSALPVAAGEAARIFIAPAVVPGESCPADRELRLRFRPTSAALDLQPDLAVRDMQLFEQAVDASGVPEPRSTLLGGTLQMLSVKVPARTLQKHELIEAVGARGRLRTAQLAAQSVALDFDGEVNDVLTGSPYVRESMMPRLLQWFLSQELLLVAWSSGLTMLGVVLGLYRWFGGHT